jgi:hypothetical protein
MLGPFNASSFSMIAHRMTHKFPKSGTLDYAVVNTYVRDLGEKAHILLENQILMTCSGPGCRIALVFMERVRLRGSESQVFLGIGTRRALE